MPLFGSDRPVLPSFRTTPELDSSTPSPYDDLNRLARNIDRNLERKLEPAAERDAERRAQEQMQEALHRNEARIARNAEPPPPAIAEPRFEELRVPEAPDARLAESRVSEPRLPANEVAERVAPPIRTTSARPSAASAALLGVHPLIEGLFAKLPEPETEWTLQARQKWLQTAASIFDLMYGSGQSDAGELTVRVERNAGR